MDYSTDQKYSYVMVDGKLQQFIPEECEDDFQLSQCNNHRNSQELATTIIGSFYPLISFVNEGFINQAARLMTDLFTGVRHVVHDPAEVVSKEIPPYYHLKDYPINYIWKRADSPYYTLTQFVPAHQVDPSIESDLTKMFIWLLRRIFESYSLKFGAGVGWSYECKKMLNHIFNYESIAFEDNLNKIKNHLSGVDKSILNPGCTRFFQFCRFHQQFAQHDISSQ